MNIKNILIGVVLFFLGSFVGFLFGSVPTATNQQQEVSLLESATSWRGILEGSIENIAGNTLVMQIGDQSFTMSAVENVEIGKSIAINDGEQVEEIENLSLEDLREGDSIVAGVVMEDDELTVEYIRVIEIQ